MKSVFGDRSRFATEFSLPESYGGVWMFGKFAYWCGGQEVGDFNLGTSLRDLLFMLEEMRRDIGKRQNPRFWNMPAADMFRLLQAGLFGGQELAPPGLADEEQWARHNITPPVDIFNNWKTFLVENETSGRIVLARSPYIEISTIELNAGEVDGVLEFTRVALEEIYERELATVKKP